MSGKNRWKITVLAYASLICLSTSAFAEESQSQPSTVQQEEEKEAVASEKDVRTLDTVVVTATRQEQSIMDVPATVDVVTQDDMEKHLVSDISDLVRYQPGIDVKKTISGTDPFGNLTGFSIRGVGGNRVQMLVDGSRVIESIQDGNRDFVDLSMMKSVEIMRGPGSVLWGADAMAGIVSYQTMDPKDLLKGKKAAGRISTGYDSFNKAHTYTAMVGAQLSENLQGLAGYTYRTYSEARFENARADGGIWKCSRIGMGCDKLNPLDGNSSNFMAKLAWTPNAYHQVKLTGESFVSDADVEQLYDKYQTSMGVKNSGSYLRNQEQSRWRLGIEHEWIVDAGWLDELTWKLSYSPQKRVLDSDRLQTNMMSNANIWTSQKTDYSEDFLQADIQLTSSFGLGPTEHRLTYGFQGDITESTYDRETTTQNFKTGVTTTTLGGGLDFSDAKTKRYDLFLQDEIAFMNGKILVTPGLRWANYKISPKFDANYKSISGKEPEKISSHELIPQLSLMFKPTQNYSVYARYAEGFKMPTAQQLYTSFAGAMGMYNITPNPELDPETVKSYEVGVRGVFDKKWWSLATFYNDYDDFIKSQQHVQGTVNDYTAMNISSVKIWGIEASAGWAFHKDWQLTGGLSYMYGKQQDDGEYGYVPFDGASPVNGFLGVKWQSPKRVFDVELVGNFTGPIKRTVNDDKFKPSGYSLFDGYINWHVAKDVQMSFGVNNIFNKRYFNNHASTLDIIPASAAFARTTPLELYTGAGRTFAVNLKVDF